MTRLPLDQSAALAYIERLTGDASTAINARLIHDADKQRPARKSRGTIAELWPQIERAQAEGFGVFVVVNEGGDTDAEITNIRAVFVDADGIALPKSWHTQPDFLVQRDDTHWHAYWRTIDLPVNRFRDVQQRLAAHYGSDPAVCNPSRVMRLAGTLHQKVARV
jgi:hypothetical protein